MLKPTNPVNNPHATPLPTEFSGGAFIVNRQNQSRSLGLIMIVVILVLIALVVFGFFFIINQRRSTIFLPLAPSPVPVILPTLEPTQPVEASPTPTLVIIQESASESANLSGDDSLEVMEKELNETAVDDFKSDFQDIEQNLKEL